MFKAIGHEKQVLIVLLWSVLIFIGYNVLTAEAATDFLDKDYNWDDFYDEETTRSDVDEACDASEDYKAHKKACDKAYDKIEKQEEADRANLEGIKKLEAQEKTTNQDWRNTVEPTNEIELKSPTVTIPYEEGDDQEDIDEKISDYNEEADESQDYSTEADSEEENESEEDDDGGNESEEE